MILPYIINVALILGAVVSFYKVLLRRETFYKMNRYVLMSCLLIAFVLPLLTIPQQFSLRKGNGEWRVASGKEKGSGKWEVASGVNANSTTSIQHPTSNLQHPTSNLQPPTSSKEDLPFLSVSPTRSDSTGGTVFSFSRLLNWIFFIYWFGVIIFGASFIFQLVLLLYRSWKYPVLKDGRYRIVELNGDQAPCSFGNTIFINPSRYDAETYHQILLHEKIHIRQRHTLDIILAELVLILQWFNPFAWIYRREIENNLEFLTDDQLVQQRSVDKRSYQLSLLKVTVPHSPLSLTSNYNQSILKKRIAMMNTKRSNLHRAWKYFFLMPVLVFLACLLNKPSAISQTVKNEKKSINVQTAVSVPTGDQVTKVQAAVSVPNRDHGTEGYWFAVIKEDKVHIRFSDEKMDANDDMEEGLHKGHSFSGNTFKLAELGTLPKGTSGTFTISREAGKMEMTGKFDGNTGMGTYKFIADKAYVDFMNKELKETADEEEQLAFFFLNVRKDYLQMLKNEGFTGIDKDNLFGMTALGVDANFIHSMRAAFKDVDMDNLVAMKALGIDENYIKEIRSTGIKNLDVDKVISFKAQGIDKEYIAKVKTMKGKTDKDMDDDDADDIVSYKAMGIDEDFVNSFKAVGLSNIPHDQLVSFKALGVTPEYIRSWQDAGFKNIDPEDFAGMKSQNVTPEYMKSFTDMGYKNIGPEDLVSFRALGVTPEYIKGWHNAGFKDIKLDEFVGMKSQNVTPEYMKSFTDMGYKNIEPENLVAFRALGITPEYIKGFEAIGYKNIDFDELPGLKSQDITPAFIKGFEELGFKNIDLGDAISAKAMGVTPAYIKEMRAKGMNYDKLEKYVRLKSID